MLVKNKKCKKHTQTLYYLCNFFMYQLMRFKHQS